MTVSIEFTASDRTGPASASARRNIEGVKREAGGLGQAFGNLERGGQRLFNGIERGYGVMTRLDLTQISLAQASDRLRQSQEELRRAIEASGPASMEAAKAHREVQKAQEEVEKTNLRANLSYVLVAGDLASIAIQAPKAALALKAFAASGSVGLGPLALAAVAVGTAFAFVSGAFGKTESFDAAGKSVGELTQRITQLRYELGLLGEEPEEARPVENPRLNAILGGLRSEYGGRRAEIMAEIEEVTAAGKQAALDLMIANEQAAAGFFFTQQRKALIASGTEAEVRAELDATNARLEKNARLLASYETTGAEREGLVAMFNADSQAAAALTGRLEELAAAGQSAIQGLLGNLGALGVEFDRLSAQAQGDLLMNVGMDPTAIKSFLDASGAEVKLTNDALKASKALRDQATITKNKGETTEEFTERLKEAGFSEADLQGRLDATTGSLISQEEATRRAADAYESATSRMSGGSRGGGAATGETFGRFASPFLAQFAAGQSAQMNGYNRTLSGMTDPGAQNGFNATGQDLYDVVQRAILGGAGDNLQSFLPGLEKTIRGERGGISLGDPSLLGALRLAGVIPAANGYDGTVSKPTLFLAGERGPERVNITPNGGASGGMVQVVQHFHGQADPGIVRGAALEGVSWAQRRIASQRAI